MNDNPHHRSKSMTRFVTYWVLAAVIGLAGRFFSRLLHSADIID